MNLNNDELLLVLDKCGQVSSFKTLMACNEPLLPYYACGVLNILVIFVLVNAFGFIVFVYHVEHVTWSLCRHPTNCKSYMNELSYIYLDVSC